MASLDDTRRAAASLMFAGFNALATVGCVGKSTDRGAPPQAWPTASSAPRTLDTAWVHLEPLGPQHAESDFTALMESREHLRRTLAWGDWPRADFTLEENRADLGVHHEEFERGEAFAYTVQSPDRARCVGCVYLNRAEFEDATTVVRLDYWVVESELRAELDRHLLENVVHWLEREWGFDAVLVAVDAQNPRGARIAGELGFKRCDARSSKERAVLARRAGR